MARDIMIFSRNGIMEGRKPKQGANDRLREALEARGYQYVKTVKEPSLKSLEKMSMDGIARALDGCRIEHDGVCQHGAPSWLLHMGFI